jgi:predicted dehydrogenase
VLRLGVVGFGYWGPNLVRNFHGHPDCRVVTIADRDPVARARAATQYPGVALREDAAEVLTAADVDAVAIATPVSSHYALARQALEHGKHVFVEKPFTATAAEAEDLIARAERRSRVIMWTIRSSSRARSGRSRSWSTRASSGGFTTTTLPGSTSASPARRQRHLGPRAPRLLDHRPRDRSSARAGRRHRPGAPERHEDLAYITLYFPNDVIAHVNVNWLSPMKVRTTLLGGDRKMLVWNDLEPAEKLKIYDKGVEITSRQGIYDLLVSYRSGDMWAPRLEEGEAPAAGESATSSIASPPVGNR